MLKTDAAELMSLLTEKKRSPLFFLAWMIQEEGHQPELNQQTNNPSNISGPIDPTLPWFRGTNKVVENNVCVYDRADQGCVATVELVRHFFPHVLEAPDDYQALIALGGLDVNGEHWATDPNYVKELCAVYEGLLPSQAHTASRYVIVEANDTLSTIASRYHTTVEELLKKNRQITNPNVINVGERILL